MNDHAENAERILADVQKALAAASDQLLMPQQVMTLNATIAKEVARAQVEATLALVDEQRTANLIEFRHSTLIADPESVTVEIAQRLDVIVIA